MAWLAGSRSSWVSRLNQKEAFNYLVRLLKRVFGRHERSGDTARRRLQLVLIHDRTSLTASTVQSLKDDLIEVVSRYMAIDKQSIEVEVKRSGDSLMLVSNIRVRDTNDGTPAPGDAAEVAAG